MAQRILFYVIVLLFTLFVAVSSSPTRTSDATQAKREARTLKYFDPRKASYERRTNLGVVGREEEAYRPKPSVYYPYYEQ